MVRKRDIKRRQVEDQIDVAAIVGELEQVRQEAREWKLLWAREQLRRRELEQQQGSDE